MNYFNQNKKQNNDIRKSSIAPLEQYFMSRDEYIIFCEKNKNTYRRCCFRTKSMFMFF